MDFYALVLESQHIGLCVQMWMEDQICFLSAMEMHYIFSLDVP